MGSEIYECTKKAFEHLKEPRPKHLLKTFMNVKFKEVNWCQKLGKGKKAQSK